MNEYSNYKLNKMNVVYRDDGRYFGRITINGKRKDFYGQTKSEVKQKARTYLQKVENGFKDPQRITLNDYMVYWLETFKWNMIEPSSYTRLYRTYECQVKDTIGNNMIGNITTEMIQELINEHANPSSSEYKSFARSGLKRLKQLLDGCLRKAVEQEVINENPCEKVLIPTESCVKKETRRTYSLSDEQMEEFRKAALSRYKGSKEYKSRDALVLLLILNLGLRVGETLALEWSDIDKENKLLSIGKTLQTKVMTEKNDSGNLSSRVKKSAKTSAGVRVLKLNDTVMRYIEELEAYDKRNGIVSPYVCSTSVGTRNSARNMQRSLDRVIGWTNIAGQVPESVTLHILRHSFGSTLIRRGVSIEVVSKLMGHSNITITYNKYIHVLQEQQAMAMDMVSVC